MRVAWIAAALMTTIAAPAPGQTVAALSAGQVRVELDAHLRTRIVAILGSEEIVVGPFTASESVSAGATEIDDFAFEGRSEERIEDRLRCGATVEQLHGQLARRGIVARQHAGDRQIVERDRDLSRDARGLRECQPGDRAKDARDDP